MADVAKLVEQHRKALARNVKRLKREVDIKRARFLRSQREVLQANKKLAQINFALRIVCNKGEGNGQS